ncbi:MAG: spore maturation protein, partial [Clostridia bacterium]|nr:spore maturation protein [Clostridia bacterium]
NMMKGIGWDKKVSAFLRPVIKRLFKGESDDAYDSIAVNLAGNMLGMGGVATPAGIDAVSKMQHTGNKASANMQLLLVINGTSIQLIPATVIALRASAGSINASSIFLPTIISSTVATVAGVIICKLISKK